MTDLQTPEALVANNVQGVANNGQGLANIAQGVASIPTTQVPRVRVATTAALVAAIFAVWLAVFLAAPRVHTDLTVHRAALFLHLAALVLGFGAVLTVDWFGLMWILRRHSLDTVLNVAQVAHVPIWLGLFGLVATGMVLTPDTSRPLTVLKLVAVLAVAINGLYARHVQRRMSALDGAPPPRSLLVRGAAAVAISQTGWWIATVVGFINAQN